MKPHLFPIILCSAAMALAGLAAPAAAGLTTKARVDTVAASSVVDLKATYAQSKQHDDQGEARKEMKAGNQLSLREIEKLVLPTMRDAEYLGPAYDAVAHAYRLKFIKDGRVMYLDVDARTGKIINRSK